MKLFDDPLEHPFLFNLSQVPFSRQKFARILGHNDPKQVRAVLDVGCGHFAGESKYGALKYLKVASDAIFSFSTIPIRAAALLGFVSVSFSALFAFYSVIAKIVFHQSPKDFTDLPLILTFLGDILLFFLGIIGEYVGRVYEEVKARPLYVVERIIGNAASNRLHSPTGRISRNVIPDRDKAFRERGSEL